MILTEFSGMMKNSFLVCLFLSFIPKFSFVTALPEPANCPIIFSGQYAKMALSAFFFINLSSSSLTSFPMVSWVSRYQPSILRVIGTKRQIIPWACFNNSLGFSPGAICKSACVVSRRSIQTGALGPETSGLPRSGVRECALFTASSTDWTHRPARSSPPDPSELLGDGSLDPALVLIEISSASAHKVPHITL